MNDKWKRIWAASSGHNWDKEKAEADKIRAEADMSTMITNILKQQIQPNIATNDLSSPEVSPTANIAGKGIVPIAPPDFSKNQDSLTSTVTNSLNPQKDEIIPGVTGRDLVNGILKKRFGVGGTAASNATPEEIQQTAQGIISGKLPPDRKYYRDTLRVDAELQKQGFNMSDASQEWKATQKFLSSVNSEKQVRLRQAISSVKDALGGLDTLNQEMARSNFAPLNKAQLAIQANSGNPLATKFLGQINIIQDELGQVFMGGNSPTERALELAAQTLKGNWSQDQLKAAMDNVRANLGYRENAINHASVQGVGSKENQGAGSRYLPAKNNPMDGTEMPNSSGLGKNNSQDIKAQYNALREQGLTKEQAKLKLGL